MAEAALAPFVAGHAARTQIETCAWVFHRDRLLIGHIESVDVNSRALLQLRDRNGVATGALEQSCEEMAYWSRVRKPIFPVPLACTNLSDVMLPDHDYGMCDAHFERILGVHRLLDAQAYLRFHASRGYSMSESVALSDLADAPDAKYGLDVKANPFAMTLEDHLLLNVRPRGTALALLTPEYPLDQAVRAWVHAQASVQRPAHDRQAATRVRDFVRDRSYG